MRALASRKNNHALAKLRVHTPLKTVELAAKTQGDKPRQAPATVSLGVVREKGARLAVASAVGARGGQVRPAALRTCVRESARRARDEGAALALVLHVYLESREELGGPRRLQTWGQALAQSPKNRCQISVVTSRTIKDNAALRQNEQIESRICCLTRTY